MRIVSIKIRFDQNKKNRNILKHSQTLKHALSPIQKTRGLILLNYFLQFPPKCQYFSYLHAKSENYI